MAYTVYVPHGIIMEFPKKKEALQFAKENKGIIMNSITNLGRVV